MASIPIQASKQHPIQRSIDALPTLMLAGVGFVSVVIVAHLAIVIWLAWVAGSPGAEALRYTWQNYVDVFADRRTYDALINTLGFSLVSLIVALVFGLPAAWLVERTDLPGKVVVFALMTVGMIIPGFAEAMGWLFLLHPRIGLLNVWLMHLFHLSQAPINITSVIGMGWVQGLNLAPLAFIMTAAVFRAMDPALEEAAQMARANLWTTMRRVTLPLAWPGIMAASIYILTVAFAAFDVPAVIGWGNRIFTFSTYLYLLVNPQDVLPRYGAAAAFSTIIMMVAALFSWWYARMQRRSRQFAIVTGKAYRPRLVALRGMVVPAWALLALYFILSKLLPITLLVWSSLLPFFQLPSGAAFRAMSFGHYLSLPWSLVRAGMANTAILMVLTPTLTLILSLAFSWVILRSKIPFRSLFDAIAFLPHAVPNIVFGIGTLLIALYVVQTAIPIYGTIWLLLVVFTIARISYGTRMTNSGLIQIHAELEESAQMCGASLRAIFRSILLPLLSSTLVYAWLWIALLVFRELTLAVILSTSGNTTLPVVVWSLWLSGGLGQASALAIVTLGLMVPIIVVYWLVARRRGAFAA
jgi:iron(III) transport system permease protein